MATDDEIQAAFTVAPASPNRRTDSTLYIDTMEDELDLRKIWAAVWRGKWIVIALATVFAAGSVVYALSLPNVYKSEALLAPSEDARGGGVSRMASQLGGLASLAGISLGGAAGDDKVNVAMAVLTSRKFIQEFAEAHQILPELLAVVEWDAPSGELRFDNELYDSSTSQWVRAVEPPKSSKPSEWEAYQAFREILTVTEDEKTGFVTVAIEHKSPVVAKKWVDSLVLRVNEVMKDKDVAEAKRSVDFLQTQLPRVALADMRTVFYQLIEEQTKTIMLAEVRDEYVFSTIDPAIIPEEKVGPKRSLIAVMGLLLGGTVGLIVVLAIHFSRDVSGRA